METGYLLLMPLLAVINFPFVLGVDWFIRSRGIKCVFSPMPRYK